MGQQRMKWAQTPTKRTSSLIVSLINLSYTSISISLVIFIHFSVFGKGRLEEFLGNHKLDVCFVYGVDPSIVTQAHSGTKNVTVVSIRTLEHFALRQFEGDFLLRPDRIIAAFLIDPENPPFGCDECADEMALEKASDATVKEELGRIDKNRSLIDSDLTAAISTLKSKQEDQRRHLRQLQREASDEVSNPEINLAAVLQSQNFVLCMSLPLEIQVALEDIFGGSQGNTHHSQNTSNPIWIHTPVTENGNVKMNVRKCEV